MTKAALTPNPLMDQNLGHDQPATAGPSGSTAAYVCWKLKGQSYLQEPEGIFWG